jgi:phosphoenolpyruvate synthase/pyruvate phosphate dikinase
MKYVQTFQQLKSGDTAIAGGKGASLGEMTRVGIPVPPGFVVLASAFDAFLAATDVGVEIAAILETANTDEMHTVEYASEKIQALILGAKMPADIANEILQAYQSLCHCEESATKQSRTISIVVWDCHVGRKADLLAMTICSLRCVRLPQQRTPPALPGRDSWKAF